MEDVKVENKVKVPTRINPKKFLFYMLLILIPVAHFLVFYVYININSFILAFTKYIKTDDGTLQQTFVGFDNFVTGFNFLFKYSYNIKNSLIFTAGNLFFVTPLTLFLSFYIYKKAPVSGFFKVILYIPQILSEIIIGIIFVTCFNEVIPSIHKAITGETVVGLLQNDSTKLWILFLFNMLFWFGINMLLYSNAMAGINESIVESCHLEGANSLQEFWYITLPMIFPTLITMIVIMVSCTFTDQFRAFTVYGAAAYDSGNVGYFLYLQAKNSDKYLADTTNTQPYTVLAAIGLMLTAVILPITLLVRHLLNKYGPKED